MNYDLLSVGGEIGEDKNGGDRRRFGDGRISSVSIRPTDYVKLTPMHGFVYCIFIVQMRLTLIQTSGLLPNIQYFVSIGS